MHLKNTNREKSYIGWYLMVMNASQWIKPFKRFSTNRTTSNRLRSLLRIIYGALRGESRKICKCHGKACWESARDLLSLVRLRTHPLVHCHILYMVYIIFPKVFRYNTGPQNFLENIFISFQFVTAIIIFICCGSLTL